MSSAPSPNTPSAPVALPAPLVRLSAMVVKTGVGLGQMTDGDRLLALALPAWCLAQGQQRTEAEVNELLKASLAAEAAFFYCNAPAGSTVLGTRRRAQ